MEQPSDRGIEQFFREGRLTVIPAKRKTRLLVLARVAESFEDQRAYSEADVNQILRRFHDDFCYLRRELVDNGFLERIASGGEYRKAEN